MQPGVSGNDSKQNFNRPIIVKYVWLANPEDFSECPLDHASLIQKPAHLEYSRDFAGGVVKHLPMKLRHCVHCDRWYITIPQIQEIQKAKVDVRGFDIINSNQFPRQPAYANWHPEATNKSASIRTGQYINIADKNEEKSKMRNKKDSEKYDNNLAFKYRYCDGGRRGQEYGYRGICSEKCFEYNIKKGDSAFCAQQGYNCRDYTQKDIKNGNYPCFESLLFHEWSCSAGNDFGEDIASPRHIARNRTGYFTMVTTNLPEESPDQRRIIAIFLIGSQNVSDGSTTVKADAHFRLELMRDEPLYFWQYYQNKSNPQMLLWGSGLYRNISNDLVILVLRDAIQVIKNPERAALAKEMYEVACQRVKREHLQELIGS